MAKKFRDYEAAAAAGSAAFYKTHHKQQCLDYVLRKKIEYRHTRASQPFWDTFAALDTLVDHSDPDLGLPQSTHALQTADAISAAGLPDWLVLTGLIHDMGKVLALRGEPQWAVVGDTHPVGCGFDPAIVHHDYLRANPDWDHPVYSSRLGIYAEHTGFDHVHFTWGHDEFLYRILRAQSSLPEAALYIVRYHSFYPYHQHGAYEYLANDYDLKHTPWLHVFQQYDLYSKDDGAVPLPVEDIKAKYEGLVAQYLPPDLCW